MGALPPGPGSWAKTRLRLPIWPPHPRKLCIPRWRGASGWGPVMQPRREGGAWEPVKTATKTRPWAVAWRGHAPGHPPTRAGRRSPQARVRPAAATAPGPGLPGAHRPPVPSASLILCPCLNSDSPHPPGAHRDLSAPRWVSGTRAFKHVTERLLKARPEVTWAKERAPDEGGRDPRGEIQEDFLEEAALVLTNVEALTVSPGRESPDGG